MLIVGARSSRPSGLGDPTPTKIPIGVGFRCRSTQPTIRVLCVLCVSAVFFSRFTPLACRTCRPSGAWVYGGFGVLYTCRPSHVFRLIRAILNPVSRLIHPLPLRLRFTPICSRGEVLSRVGNPTAMEVQSVPFPFYQEVH